jgi:hypothetical protein
MLSIRMLDFSTLQARLVAFGRYSVACDILTTAGPPSH